MDAGQGVLQVGDACSTGLCIFILAGKGSAVALDRVPLLLRQTGVGQLIVVVPGETARPVLQVGDGGHILHGLHALDIHGHPAVLHVVQVSRDHKDQNDCHNGDNQEQEQAKADASLTSVG